MPLNTLPAREEFLRKKRRRRLWKIGISFFLFVGLLVLLSYVSYRPQIRISKVELTGGVLVTREEVAQKSLEYFSGSYLWMFPKNNALLYPRKGLENYLKESFRRIDTVDIFRKDFKTIIVNITERKPFAIWCNVVPDMERCYFMDSNSTIFAESPQFSGDAYFKYYGLITTDNPIGLEYMSSTTQFSEISDFVSRVRKMGIRPQYISAKGDGDFSLTVFGGGQIYFDTKESLSKVADNLEALLRTTELSTTTNSNLPVDYIDMRYGNKLFYKLK